MSYGMTRQVLDGTDRSYMLPGKIGDLGSAREYQLHLCAIAYNGMLIEYILFKVRVQYLTTHQ
jgi:hypothetical protein